MYYDSLIGTCHKLLLIYFSNVENFESIRFAGSHGKLLSHLYCSLDLFRVISSLSLKPGSLLCHLVYGLEQHSQVESKEF